MVFSDLLNFQRTGMTSRAIHDRIEREMNAVQTLGGADWNRTSDPLLAKQVLSQLSYSPDHKCMIVNFEPPREILTLEAQLVGLDRIELSTPRLSSACSSQLSYRPSRLLSHPKTIINSRVALHLVSQQ